ncbi:stage III sporulation protein AA [Bacillus sp. 2205SS5-2]|uniref:stage III sporulation protein AA n=1 Tax=Bacillus sp. 2205SS5-2 TaxID=3109031 RepID=UPI0030045005
MEEVFAILPSAIRQYVLALPDIVLENLEEIRIRIQRPLEITAKGKPLFLSYVVKAEDAEALINRLAQYSFYTLEEELKRGYITISGGHRVGLAGKVILEHGEVKAIRQLSSFNIRVARQKIGIGDPLIPYLFDKKWMHTMIIGPPQTGKTTLLRDLARVLSTGLEEQKVEAKKVGIVDERSEIAGCVKGVPQLAFGHRVDVLDACPKAEGMMMMIRSMSPDVLIVDEIGREEDAKALLEAVNAGITLMMTTHGHSYLDIKKRPILKKIMDLGIIDRYIELSRESGPGSISTIRDAEGRCLQSKVSVT